MAGVVGRVGVLAAACVLGGVLGCSSVPTYPEPPRDSGVQCSATLMCPAGRTCLQGLCFAMCDAMHTCGPREMCAGGMCVARTSDGGVMLPDMGVDAGRCALLRCTAATPVCAFDMCLQCQSSITDCGGALGPICDIARGNCVAATPQYCAPCNNDRDCTGTPTPSTCVSRMAPNATERVCLPTAVAGACPNGFTASGTSCAPAAFSCTAFRSAEQTRACTTDADCPQLGATTANGVWPGMCRPDAVGRPMTCHAACTAAHDCPASQPTCDAMTGFCHP